MMESNEIFTITEDPRNSIPELEVNDVPLPRNKCQKIFDSVRKTFMEFCSVSSIGACTYLTSKSIFHRIAWLIVLITSLFFCYLYIVRLLGSREILVLNERNTISTSEIPFPAITVCTSVKADHRKFNYTDEYKVDLLNRDELSKNDLLNRLFFKKISSRNPSQKISDQIVLHNLEQNIKTLGIKEEDLIVSCSFNNKTCEWSQILTKEGVCYAFNLVSPEDMFKENMTYKQYSKSGTLTKGWSFDNGYEDKFRTDVYPLRGVFFDQLKIRLQMHKNDLINSNPNKQNGFIIYAGHPMDYPYNLENKIFIPLNVQYTLTVTPDVILAQEELKNYPFNVRNCFIKQQEWNHMTIFKEYSLNNCLFECMGQITLINCNCSQFYVPGPINSQTCGNTVTELICYTFAIENRMTREIRAVNNPDKLKKYCNCHHACSSINYDIQERMTGTIPIKNNSFFFSDVIVKFSSPEILPKMRQESYSNLDLLSAIGGNLGLFVGASVTSFFELIYYFSIKICFDVLGALV